MRGVNAFLALAVAVGGCAGKAAITAPPGGVVLTVFVRNASEVPAQFVIELGPDRGAAKAFSFGKTVGIACNGVPPGSRVVLEGGPSAGSPDPAPKLVILDLPSDESAPFRGVDIDAQGAATLGEGVPAWWSGSRTC
jgi:hypothetical protein